MEMFVKDSMGKINSNFRLILKEDDRMRISEPSDTDILGYTSDNCVLEENSILGVYIGHGRGAGKNYTRNKCY